MTLNFKAVTIGSVLVATTIIGGLYAVADHSRGISPVVQTPPVGISQTPSVRISGIGPDLSDSRRLVGASHNVFVGKVIRQIGSDPQSGVPSAQFEVEVILNIKGDLSGSTTVNQFAVSTADAHVEDSTPLLQLGATYLFAARGGVDRHTITPPLGSALITADGNLDISQLKTIAENNDRVKQLQVAYPYEILLDADIKHNYTTNSYKSLHPESR